MACAREHPGALSVLRCRADLAGLLLRQRLLHVQHYEELDQLPQLPWWIERQRPQHSAPRMHPETRPPFACTLSNGTGDIL